MRVEGQGFQKVIVKLHTAEKGCDWNSFVPAVLTVIIPLALNSRDSICG